MPWDGGRRPQKIPPIDQSSSRAQTVTVSLKRRSHVVRTLCDWVRNHDRRTDLRRAPGAHAHALDCHGRDHTLGPWDSVGGKGNAAEGSSGIKVLSESDSRWLSCAPQAEP